MGRSLVWRPSKCPALWLQREEVEECVGVKGNELGVIKGETFFVDATLTSPFFCWRAKLAPQSMRSPRPPADTPAMRHSRPPATSSRPAGASPPPPRRTPRAGGSMLVNASPARATPGLPRLSPLFVGAARYDTPRRVLSVASASALEVDVDTDDEDENAFLLDDAWADDDGAPAPGPPVTILAGFRQGEPAVVRGALDDAGFSSVAVVPASHALLLLPAREALYTAREPDWSAPARDDAPRGGGIGARRAVLFGGVTLEQQAALLATLEAAIGAPVFPAEADELTWDTERAGDVLAAALRDADADAAAAARAGGRAPRGVRLPPVAPSVEALPPVEAVLAAAGVNVDAPFEDGDGGAVVVDVTPGGGADEGTDTKTDPPPPPPPPQAATVADAVPTDWRDRAAASGADFMNAIAGNASGARAGGALFGAPPPEDDNERDADVAPPTAGLTPGGASVLDAVVAGEAAPPPPAAATAGDERAAYLAAAMAADAATRVEGDTPSPPRRPRKPPPPVEPDATDVFMRSPAAAAAAEAGAAAAPPPTTPRPITLAPVGLNPGEDALHDELVADLDAKFKAMPASDKAALRARMVEEARSPTRDAIAAAIACGLSPSEVKAMVDDAAAAAAEAGGLTVPWGSMVGVPLVPTAEEEAEGEGGGGG